jgi:hypothetical protein
LLPNTAASHPAEHAGMTRTPIPRQPRRLPWRGLALAAVPVVLGHVWLLDGLYGLRQPHSLLAEMAAPVYTRVLAQSEAQAPVAPVDATQAASARMQSRTIAPPEPKPAAPEAAEPAPPQAAASAAEPASRRKSEPDRPRRARAEEPDPRPEPRESPTATDDPPTDAPPPAPDASLASASPASAASAARDGDTQVAAGSPRAGNTEPNAGPAASAASADAGASSAAAPASSPRAPSSRESTPPPAAPAGPDASAARPGDERGATRAADAWPPNTRLNYRLSGNYRGELHGTARVLWQKTGNQYQAQVDLDLGLLASMRLTSQGEITAQSLVPRVYEELVRKKRRNVRLGEESLHLANGETVPRPPGVQDTASQFVELSHRFATGQVPLAVGQSVGFALARPNRVAQWTYDVVAETTLHLPLLGPTRTLQVKPRPVDSESAQNASAQVSAQMWLAPSLQYLPVRIVLTMGNGQYEVDLLLERIDQGDGSR